MCGGFLGRIFNPLTSSVTRAFTPPDAGKSAAAANEAQASQLAAQAAQVQAQTLQQQQWMAAQALAAQQQQADQARAAADTQSEQARLAQEGRQRRLLAASPWGSRGPGRAASAPVASRMLFGG